MPDSNTIIVAEDAIKESAAMLRALCGQWQSTPYIHAGSFRQSVGYSADMLDSYAAETQEVSAALRSLLEKTYSYFVSVSDNFAMADLTASKMIQSN